MAIDLNGSATGLNYATTYQEEDPAASIVSSTATVGSSSNSANTDQIAVIDVDGRDGPMEDVQIAVTSILGELMRALEAADTALQARADAGPLPPTAATAAADSHAAWTLHDTRAALAQAVAQALAEAVPTADGGMLMGTSLEPALRALGMGDGASLLLDATEPNDDLLSEDWFNTLTLLSFRDTDDDIGAVSLVVKGTSYELDQLVAS